MPPPSLQTCMYERCIATTKQLQQVQRPRVLKTQGHNRAKGKRLGQQNHDDAANANAGCTACAGNYKIRSGSYTCVDTFSTRQESTWEQMSWHNRICTHPDQTGMNCCPAPRACFYTIQAQLSVLMHIIQGFWSLLLLQGPLVPCPVPHFSRPRAM